jgi:23S rRNA (guanosine2251-2'-O)-methyltransferase
MSNYFMLISLILHNIRSAHNVGSIFRTADAAGVTKIYLTGYTPAPTDKFGRINKEIDKTALGAEKNLEWEKRDDVLPLLYNLKTKTYNLIALEQSPNSVNYKTLSCRTSDVLQTAIIVGNEVSGLDPEILKLCDLVAEIPMRGKKESLNVSVATGIFLFRLLDR